MGDPFDMDPAWPDIDERCGFGSPLVSDPFHYLNSTSVTLNKIGESKNMDTAQSKILAELESTNKTNYDEIKNVEASAGGRQLPGGVEGAVAVITDAKLDKTDREGKPYVFLYSSVCEPQEYEGIFNGMFYGLTEDRFNTADDNQRKFVNDMKLIGFGDIIQNAPTFAQMVMDIIDAIKDQNNTFAYTFNTGNRQKRDGSYSVFVQSAAENYERPKMTPKMNKPASNTGYMESHAPTAKTTASSRNGSADYPEEGTEVTTTGDYYEDGSDYTGTVVKVNKRSKKVTVEFEDGEDEVPLDSLTWESVPFESSDNGSQIEVEDRVTTTNDHFGDGTDYAGVVTSVNGEKATVLFDDDGSEQDIPLADLVLEN